MESPAKRCDPPTRGWFCAGIEAGEEGARFRDCEAGVKRDSDNGEAAQDFRMVASLP